MESRAASLEAFLERHEVSILAIWSLVYFAGTILRARGKPFWYDEILTLLEARQPTLSQSLRDLGDLDWMPPANHLTFYLTNKLIGTGEVAFRIPVMIAFWVFCICLYLFARRRVSIFFALFAMLLPYASVFRMYSYEARSYAIMLAFCGIALVSWQAAAEDRLRPWSLVGLALGIGGAIAFQYWSVLLYLPLACAEAYRTIKNRRIDWQMLAALAAGAASLAASLPLILHGMKSWSPRGVLHVHPSTYYSFYAEAFRVPLSFAIPALLLLGLWFLSGGRKEQPANRRKTVVPLYEWIMAGCLLFIPIIAISIALLVPPHDFVPRYAAPAVAGFALLGAFLAARFSGRRSSIGLFWTLAALGPFLYLMVQPSHPQNPFHKERGLAHRLEDGPVVVEDFRYYVKLWYYAPEQLKPRLLFLSAGRSRDRVGGHFAELVKLGVPILPYARFAQPGTQFVLYPKRRSKLARRIVKGGGTVETISRPGRHPLLLAQIK